VRSMATTMSEKKQKKPAASRDENPGVDAQDLSAPRATVHGDAVVIRRLPVQVPFVTTAKYAQKVVYLELRDAEAATLRGVLEGLEQIGAKMPNGKPVASSQDALRWVLQELARV
jgi:hypothetical protein